MAGRTGNSPEAAAGFQSDNDFLISSLERQDAAASRTVLNILHQRYSAPSHCCPHHVKMVKDIQFLHKRLMHLLPLCLEDVY